MISKIAGLVSLLVVSCAFAQGTDPALREVLTQVGAADKPRIAGHRLFLAANLVEFYQKRHYRPLWTRDTARAVVDVLSTADTHGLVSSDYHTQYLLRSLPQLVSANARDRAQFEVLATDALFAYAQHLKYGKVDPKKLSTRWGISNPVAAGKMLDQMTAAIGSGQINAWMQSLAPSFSVYSQMRDALARYRTLAARGGWQQLPTGPWLQLPMRHPHVVILRKRLHTTGDLVGAQNNTPDEFDLTLDRAVRRFQHRHGIAVDGVVGPETRAALNTPADVRVQQLRTNLERARWVLHDIKGRTVVVNLAGFSIYLADDESIQWASRVVIGRTYRKTPVFRSQIRYLVLNPNWVVPPTIFKKDILPLAIKDPAVIRSKGLKVLTRSGTEVSPESIQWQRYQSQPFPYILRQDPGPNNALGKIKFVFPNPYTVFMHDTPERELFDRHERAFSSGCIRLKAPMELAALLLAASPQWNREKLLAAVETGRTRVITLPDPVDIVIIYWTAGVDPTGVVHFRRDIYRRDPAVQAALDRIHK